MAALQSDAIVLSTIRYGETSKVVRLATREHGVLSAIAKGALRPRSRFGAALQTLSSGVAQFIPPRSGDLHTLTAFDLHHVPISVGDRLECYAAASAIAETVQRFASADPRPEVFEALERAILALERAGAEEADPLGIRLLWQMTGLLGFEPAVAACALDGTVIPPGERLAFSAIEGGALCAACARTRAANMLAPEDRGALEALMDAGPLPALDRPHAAAHRRLLARFIQHQLGEGAALPALEFWMRQPWRGA